MQKDLLCSKVQNLSSDVKKVFLSDAETGVTIVASADDASFEVGRQYKLSLTEIAEEEAE